MKVYFVGAGPGDPDLLTRKAERLLRTARVCVYAGSLLSPAILELLPDDAEKYDSAWLTLQEIVDVFRNARSRGLDVVRLHSGDPTIYSAVEEQIRELKRLGIAFEIVPGISSFQAAAAKLGWELTVPEVSQSVVLTRLGGRTPLPETQVVSRFAVTRSTLCLFLSVSLLENEIGSLREWYGDDCPAAVVYRVGWPDEKIIECTLRDVIERIKAAGISRTAMIIIRPKGKDTRSRLYAPEFNHGCRQG